MVGPEGTKRISKTDTYLNVAEAFAYRSTCIKRKYGAVIVKDDVVISTGYNGSPRGYDNCCDIGECPRIKLGMHQGEGYGLCRAIHAEQNALLNCSREQTIGADLYLAGINPGDNSVHRAKPCPICSRLIIQAGIKNVYLRVGAKAGEYRSWRAISARNSPTSCGRMSNWSRAFTTNSTAKPTSAANWLRSSSARRSTISACASCWSVSYASPPRRARPRPRPGRWSLRNRR